MLGRERHVPCGSFDSLVPIFGPPSIERAACLGSTRIEWSAVCAPAARGPCSDPSRTLAWLHFPRTELAVSFFNLKSLGLFIVARTIIHKVDDDLLWIITITLIDFVIFIAILPTILWGQSSVPSTSTELKIAWRKHNVYKEEIHKFLVESPLPTTNGYLGTYLNQQFRCQYRQLSRPC